MSWIVTIDGRSMIPVDFNTNKIQESIEDYFRIRIKLNGSLTFINNHTLGINDFSYIKGLSKSEKHTVFIQEGKKEFNGEFSYYQCQFDETEEKVIINVDPRDKYTIINEGEDILVNVLTDNKFIQSDLKSYLEFKCYKYETRCSNVDPDEDIMPEAFSEYWSLYWQYNEPLNSEGKLVRYRIFAQERVMVNSYRTMAGWDELDTQEGYILYGRAPVGYSLPTSQSWAHIEKRPLEKTTVNPPYFQNDDYLLMGGLQYLELVLLINIETGEPFPCNYDSWVLPDESGIIANMFVSPSIYNGSGHVSGMYNYYKAYNLKECLSTILSVAMPDFTGEIKSTFLFSDIAESGGPDFYTGYYGHNYVYNRLNYELCVIEKSDFKKPFYSKTVQNEIIQPATEGYMTFKNVVSFYKNFNVFWFIDSDGNVRFEHIAYKTLKPGINISQETTLFKKYQYLDDEIPNREIFIPQEGWSSDFIQKEIVYGNIPVLDGTYENKDEKPLSFFTTDIIGGNKHITEIIDSGFMLIEVDNLNLQIKKDTGKYSGLQNVENVGLSLANMLFKYNRHNVYKQEFTMFGLSVIAITLKKLKYQPNVVYLSDQKPDLNEDIQTNLGTGEIETLEYPTNDEDIFTMKVLYD